jgi:hypothetical protein
MPDKKKMEKNLQQISLPERSELNPPNLSGLLGYLPHPLDQILSMGGIGTALDKAALSVAMLERMLYGDPNVQQAAVPDVRKVIAELVRKGLPKSKFKVRSGGSSGTVSLHGKAGEEAHLLPRVKEDLLDLLDIRKSKAASGADVQAAADELAQILDLTLRRGRTTATDMGRASLENALRKGYITETPEGLLSTLPSKSRTSQVTDSLVDQLFKNLREK